MQRYTDSVGRTYHRYYTVATTTWSSWKEMWDSGNDGTGSGLDADLLDGNEATAFLNTSSTSQIKLGDLTLTGGEALTLKAGATANAVYFTFYKDSTDQTVRSGFIGFSNSGKPNLYVTNEMTNGYIYLRPKGTGSVVIDDGVGLTMGDGKNIVIDTTTGTKIGTADTQKIGFFGNTPIVQRSGYTQTYSTANKTHAARTAAALTDNSGGTVSTTIAYIAATYSQFVIGNAFASLADQHNKLRNDMLDTAQALNSLIDDLQALGLVR